MHVLACGRAARAQAQLRQARAEEETIPFDWAAVPNWCSNCIDVAGPHADVVAAAARLMACEVDDDELMSDIAHGVVSTQPLAQQGR